MVRQHVVGYHWLEESVVVVHLISIIDDRAGYNENAAAARGIEGELLSSTQGLNTVFKQGQAFDEIHNDVIHSKCISKTNFMSGIDVYVYHWPYSNII